MSRPRTSLAFLAASAALHAALLGGAWLRSLGAPVPMQVDLVAPVARPDESAAPRTDLVLGEPAPDEGAAAGARAEPDEARTGAAAGARAEPDEARTGAAEASVERAVAARPRAGRPAVTLPRAAADRDRTTWGAVDPEDDPALPAATASQPLAQLQHALAATRPASEPAAAAATAAGDGAGAGPVTGGFRAVADISGYGPGAARLTLLLRTDRIRRSPYAADLGHALERYPDDRMLAARAGIDVIADLDSLLIATTDPMDVTATFLAARHSLGDAALRRRFEGRAAAGGARITWTERGGRPVGALPPLAGAPPDPRVLVLLRPGVAVFSRPEHVAALVGAAGSAAPDAGVGEWPARLSTLEVETGTEPDGAALLLTLADIRSFAFAAHGESLPIPRTARLLITGLAAEPMAYFELGFDAPAQAERFAAEWPARAARLVRHPLVFLSGLGGIAERLETRAVADRVRARVDLRPAELRQILRLIAQIPAPPAAATQPASQGTGAPAAGL